MAPVIIFSRVLTALIWMALAVAAHSETFALTSTDYAEGDTLRPAQLYYGLGCNGENLSPHLAWSGAPTGTRSFAVVMEDVDAPAAIDAWHWVVFNIPAEVTELPAGSGDPKVGLVPEAIQSRSSFGDPGYAGACPPAGQGAHRYQFRVYALKVEQLALGVEAPAAEVAAQIEANKLAEAQLEVKIGR
ncbi:YbhB/YbcL family Raf kinase inhibitor-like protein [Microbulbifer agarilyticus]|uniref:YbhB/YbcL family Raf kinase inhibitor-like protein n=1 Tax=Microbulbifer agarilyticus TaxID=260552 RepID=UPI001CD4BCA2|nr:YbhB/YbcL family Raf kinase inhibitor-like protein [Microbulbifer agarilyticus]MCA0900505.1 YbhB/YbcL family Raf kinase inhibitor-like protein [Microbulbifer agarilyticus]